MSAALCSRDTKPRIRSQETCISPVVGDRHRLTVVLCRKIGAVLWREGQASIRCSPQPRLHREPISHSFSLFLGKTTHHLVVRPQSLVFIYVSYVGVELISKFEEHSRVGPFRLRGLFGSDPCVTPSPGCIRLFLSFHTYMLSPQVGVINAMRTGNVVFDMMIAMSIPLALQGLFKFLEWLRPRIEDFVLSFQRQEFYYTRSIDHEKVRRVGSTAAEGSQSFR